MPSLGELHATEAARLSSAVFAARPALTFGRLPPSFSASAGLMRSVPAIKEIDINPVAVYPAQGRGALALDAG